MTQVPRVISNAVDGAQGEPLPSGYSPGVSVQIARAHCWARYEDVVSALRFLGNLKLLEQPAGLAAARTTFDALFSHPAPFDADVRFPEGEVYMCLELPPLALWMRRINNDLQRLEATTGGWSITWRDEEAEAAWAKVKEAVGNAAEISTSVWAGVEDPNKPPVMYDRVVFEERFRLTWTNDDVDEA